MFSLFAPSVNGGDVKLAVRDRPLRGVSAELHPDHVAEVALGAVQDGSHNEELCEAIGVVEGTGGGRIDPTVASRTLAVTLETGLSYVRVRTRVLNSLLNLPLCILHCDAGH